jgi:hypothetical protein
MTGSQTPQHAKQAREPERNRFLENQGWRPEAASLLAADASFRCYFRLRQDGHRAVLMDAPPPMEDVRPFVRMARHLASLGLSAPKIHAVDADDGFVLLEDFGDDTYTRLLNQGVEATTLYSLAIDSLIHLHTRTDATHIDLPHYDQSRLLQEASLLTDWFVPAHRGTPIGLEAGEHYLDIWRSLLARVESQPPMLVLRDYHVDNLMRLPGQEGIAACGLLDFQDAVIGSRAYDLVSLLEDARRDVPCGLRDAMLTRYLRAFPGISASALKRELLILGVQRHCKVAGIFVRLNVRDGKPGYLHHIERVMGLLERGLQNPLMEPLRAWFDDNLPDRLAFAKPGTKP